MTKPGRVFVAPVNPDEWADKGWTELGWTTEGEVMYEPVWAFDPVRENGPLDLSAMVAAFKTMTVSLRGVSEVFRALSLHLHRRSRPARVSRMRSAYRHKRGRRRFR